MRLAPLFLLAALPALLTACGEPADTHPGQPVTQRRTAFKKILRAFEPMGVQLREHKYDPDKFLDQAKALAAAKDGPWEYFGPDTNYPPTRAKAVVWSDGERFATNRRTFLDATDKLVEAAGQRDEQAARAAYDAVHEACSNCHKDFKEK